MICRWSHAWLSCFLVFGLSTWTQAADPFPPTVEISGKTLKKNGEALCEWGIFGLDLYRVALWVESPSSEPEVLLQQNTIRCLELYFVRALSQKQMRKAYRESIKANHPADDEELKTSIDKFLDSVQAAALLRNRAGKGPACTFSFSQSSKTADRNRVDSGITHANHTNQCLQGRSGHPL